MNLRIDYNYKRGYDQAQYNWSLDTNIPEITTKAEFKAYLRDWAKEWTGEGQIEIIDVCESIKNDNLKLITDDFKGQIIEFIYGKITLKRKKI
jgi:hypothetical protein